MKKKMSSIEEQKMGKKESNIQSVLTVNKENDETIKLNDIQEMNYDSASLISEQPLSQTMKVFRPEMYQLTFDIQQSNSEFDQNEKEFDPYNNCDSYENSYNQPSNSIKTQSRDSYVVFDPESSNNGQMNTSRKLLNNWTSSSSSLLIMNSINSDRCCCLM